MVDVVMVTVDTALIVDELIAFQLGTKTAFSSIGWQEKSATGQAYYDSSWSEIFGNAGRVGLGAGTLGVSEIVAGLWQYGRDGDVDVFQQTMGGVAAGNAVAAVGAKVTGANPRFDFKAKTPKSFVS